MCIYVYLYEEISRKNLKIHIYRAFFNPSFTFYMGRNRSNSSRSNWAMTSVIGEIKMWCYAILFFFSAVFHVYFRLSFCPVEDTVTKDRLLKVPMWNHLLKREVSCKHLIIGFTYFWITNNFGYSILLTQYMNRQCCLLSTVDHFYSFLRCYFEILFWIHQIQAMKRMCTAFCGYFFLFNFLV